MKCDAKVALITGGGKGGGIGYGLSTAFAKAGYNLVITGRNTKKLDEAKEELERLYGIQVLTCPGGRRRRGTGGGCGEKGRGDLWAD